MIEETIVHCPSCGEAVALAVDTSAGDEQEYVEDCAVCCRPWAVHVSEDEDGVRRVEIAAAQ